MNRQAIKTQGKQAEEKMPTELENAGITEEYLKKLGDYEKYELLEDAGLVPDEYSDRFQNFKWISENITCIRQLKARRIPSERMETGTDAERCRLLQENGLNPHEFDGFLEDSVKALREFDREQYFKTTGADLNWFHSLSDVERVEWLVMKGFSPFDFIDEFDDFQTALQKADEIEQLETAGISYFSFRWKTDLEKLELLIQADLQPYAFYVYFDSPEKVEEEYERRMLLADRILRTGKTSWFKKTDVEKAEILLRKGLHPQDYRELFTSFDRLEEELAELEDKVYGQTPGKK